VSETAGLERFEPRPDREGRPAVWAITRERLQNYLLPRDCPRVTFYALPGTSSEDRERFLGGARSVVAIEARWETRARETALSVYEFAEADFALKDTVAGYYTADTPQTPLSETRHPSALAALEQAGTDVRVLPELWRLREAVVGSTLGFSVIRFRNAGPSPQGFETRYPAPPAPSAANPAGA
jgi:hypothetical protein